MTLPTELGSRDLRPTNPLFRFNIHLALNYHLVHVFIGRVFIFTSQSYKLRRSLLKASSDPQKIVNELVSDCVESSLQILSLCQQLKDAIGIARASYTEFTTCRTAILVILTQRIHDRSGQLRDACDHGMSLLRHMSLGIYATYSDKPVIEAMEMAVRRLDTDNPIQSSQQNLESQSFRPEYDRFKQWAELWNAGRTAPDDYTNNHATTHSGGDFKPPTENPWDGLPALNFDYDMYNTFLPFEMNDCDFIPETSEHAQF
jgi:hypothetical protein